MEKNEPILEKIKTALADLANTKNKDALQRYFKTEKGDYGEGDVFIGVKVPEQREVAKAFYKTVSLDDIQSLLKSEIHEHRLTAVILLTLQYAAFKTIDKKKMIVDCYLNNRAYVNNWDIVDSSTHKILGPYIAATQAFNILFELADETSIWSKRMAVVAMWHLWKKGFITEGLKLLEKNLQHPHDLMHKANGWMLRELAAIDEDCMLIFLEKHYAILPRTTLRYAIEKLDKDKRLAILKEGKF
jgi:3-methyladenine DNA glycosylase AlkD